MIIFLEISPGRIVNASLDEAEIIERVFPEWFGVDKQDQND